MHHHGRGHLARATSICAHLREPVTILTSLVTPELPGISTVRLPRDDEGGASVGADGGGALHWAPLHDTGLRERMALITEWVSTHRPRVMVVDVSVEVTLLVRLLGVPVVVVAMPGDRTDLPHELAYRTAEHIVAPWPQKLYEPPWLTPHSHKTTYVGGISRFAGRRRPPPPAHDRPSILVLNGSGGADLTTDTVDRCAAAHPGFAWTTLGVKGGPWAEDPWPALCAADVVVSSAGQSSVADIAAAGRPAIIVAEDRPFAEQAATARALHRAGLAVVRPRWPDLADWPHLVDDARALGSDVWDRWQTSHSAARAAALVDQVAAA